MRQRRPMMVRCSAPPRQSAASSWPMPLHCQAHPAPQRALTAVGFELTPLRNGALSHRLRPLGQSVLRGSSLTTPSLQVQTRTAVLGLEGCRRACLILPSSSLAACPQQWPLLVCTVAILAQGTNWAVAPAQAYWLTAPDTLLPAPRVSYICPHQLPRVMAIDSCGVRTHALTEWRLKPPP